MRKGKPGNGSKNGVRNVLLCAAAVFCLGLNVLTADAAAGTVTADSAVIRSTAGTTGEKLAGVKKGETLDVISKTQGSDGNEWYQVHVNGSTKGYIRADLISVSEEVPASSGTGGEAAGAETGGQTTETAATVTSSSAATGTVTKASVNVRKGPAATDAIVGSVKQGNVVNITGETTGSDGKIWYQVSFQSNGRDVTGFIRSDLMETQEAPPEEEVPEEVPETEAPEEGGDQISKVISSKILPKDVALQNTEIDESLLESWEDGQFYLLYMKGEDGSKFYYLYDLEKHAYQRADSFNTGAPEAETGNDGGFGTTAKIIVIILSVVVVILIAIIVLLSLKLREKNWDDDYEDDDEEEEEDEEDDEGRVNSRAWRPRNFLRTSYEEDEEDDEDEEEEDEEEDYPPRRPVRRSVPRQENVNGAVPRERDGAAPRRRPVQGSAALQRGEVPPQRGEMPPRRRPVEGGPVQRNEGVPRRRPAEGSAGPDRADAPRRSEGPQRRRPADGNAAPDRTEALRRPEGPQRRRPVEGSAGPDRAEASQRSEGPQRRRPAEGNTVQRSGEPQLRRPAEGNAPEQGGPAQPRKKPAPRKSFYEEDDEFEFEFLNMDGKDD